MNERVQSVVNNDTFTFIARIAAIIGVPAAAFIATLAGIIFYGMKDDIKETKEATKATYHLVGQQSTKLDSAERRLDRLENKVFP